MGGEKMKSLKYDKVRVALDNYPEVRKRIGSVIRRKEFSYVLLNSLVEIRKFEEKEDLEDLIKVYKSAARNYSKEKLFEVFDILSEYDMKSKGLGASFFIPDIELIKEMCLRILN